MSAEAKPLHVRVAEALGEARNEHSLIDWDGDYLACLRCEYQESWGDKGNDRPQCIPRYDTDWSATGPLIEKYRIRLWTYGDEETSYWLAAAAGHREAGTNNPGDSPLIAVCNLILALKEAGKL